MAGLSDDTLIQLLQMTAESMEVDPAGVEITDELEDEVERYEDALQDALELVARGFPPGRDITAQDLWDAEASYLVFMTLRGEGVGIWDGSWDDFFDEREIKEVEKLLESRLHSFADDSGAGSLNEALMNAVDDSEGEPEDEDEDEDEPEDEEDEDEDEKELEPNMDPDAALARFWKAYHNSESDEAYEAAQDLKEWLAQGGFAPKWSKYKGGRRQFEFVAAAIENSVRIRQEEPEPNKKLPLRRNHSGGVPTELAANVRRTKYVYRVMGTADAYRDRQVTLGYSGTATISNLRVASEEEARALADSFMRREPPQGRDARVWIEEHNPRTGDTYKVAKWNGDDRSRTWVVDYDRKP